MDGNNFLIVTRHKALVEWIFERGIAPAGTQVIPYASEDDVRDRDCIGHLPLRFASLARSVTDIQMYIPEDRLGQELTLDDVRQMVGEAHTYIVLDAEISQDGTMWCDSQCSDW